jgi:hypothetical protein
MKKSAILFLIFFIQNTEVIKLKEYYSGEGVIFNKNVKYPFIEPNYKVSYTPTVADVNKTEKFLMSHYYEYETNVLDSFNLDKSRIKYRYKKPENVKKKFYKYNRQYAGYINKSNDTIIYVGLLNFSNKKNAEHFEGWKEMIYFGFGVFYEKNQKTYEYNLTKNKFVYKIR